jgi:hypothetical protein
LILKKRGSVKRRLWRMNMWRRTEELVQLMDFEDEG